jgi:hypothetical protein
MADHWQQIHGSLQDRPGGTGLEEAGYVAGWILSCAAVAAVVLLMWHFNV